MHNVLLPTAYLPPISWMALASRSDEIFIEVHETYPKQTYRNRCNIAASGGKFDLIVPVVRVDGNHTKTLDVQIDNSTSWQKMHWRSILSAYNKTPYFIFYRDLFEPVYMRKFVHLLDLNAELLQVLLKIFKIKSEVSFTTEYDSKSQMADFRNSFRPHKPQRADFQYYLPRYIQAFESRYGFLPDLSILDILFNLGPDSATYLSAVVPLK